jgi:prepilin-type N-terminal cleavage/methylation domain-containing protein
MHFSNLINPMAKPVSSWFQQFIKHRWLASRRHPHQGFTLLELLVVVTIAGGIVAGLMYVVVQLMTTDQREASRTETQREMQMALDYISADLREAVYIYSGDYLRCTRTDSSQACRGSFTQFLPPAVAANSVPVLAFWKQQALPQAVRERCATQSAAALANIPCLAGHSYALVVYSLTQNTNTPTWRGKARITRYVLSQFDANGNPNPGYVNPGDARNFETWPFGIASSGVFEDLQASVGRPTGTPATLVDFVDFSATIDNPGEAVVAGQTGACPTGDYSISPDPAVLTGDFANVRSFYACVFAPTRNVRQGSTTVSLPDPSRYRDVVLYLRGNAAGRPGILPTVNNDADLLPTLQTRVLSRSVLGRTPTE